MNVKQDVLLLGRLLAPELGASATTSAGPWMDPGDSDPGGRWRGCHALLDGQAGQPARCKYQDQPEQRVPVPDCGPAKCQGLRGADVTQQTTLAPEGSLLTARRASLCSRLGPGLREDKYPFPGPFCSLPATQPGGISASHSLLEPSARTGQAAKCPFCRVLGQPRPLPEPLIYKLFVRPTCHSCSTPEDGIVPTPTLHWPGVTRPRLRGNPRGAPLAARPGSRAW